MPEIFLYQVRNARITQMTFSVTFVQIRFNLALFFFVIFQCQKGLPLTPPRSGHGVGQPISDELASARRVKVWKLFGSIPAFEALLDFPWGKRFGPLLLASDELFEVIRFHGFGVGTARPHWSNNKSTGTGRPRPAMAVVLLFITSGEEIKT